MSKEPTEEALESERGVATMGALLAFGIALALTFLALFVFEAIPVWIRVLLSAATCFFGWLLFFASSRTRVAILRWFPWP